MNIQVDINLDYLWGDEHFKKENWGDITYIVGANGTGKTLFAEQLKTQFQKNGLKVRYFGADRINLLSNKWDTQGYFSTDSMSNGLNISYFDKYKERADTLGQSVDALIELRNKLDLRIKIESILADVFGKQLTISESGGFLNYLLTNTQNGGTYDLKKSESHGLKEIITLLSFLYNDDYNCIILDEPELNLHPQFQQFILSEIKKCAGLPSENKKMFIILTHSPYMLDINSSNDLLNYIVFHKNMLPTYIPEYTLDAYQLERLNKLLMRINTNHKTFFFANSPVFVEGYIDQQIFNLIANKRDISLGAGGTSIIDVGGKDEVDIMYSLCQLLKINAKSILDLDALFEGKIRQTISNLPASCTFMASKGHDNLMKSIGDFETLIIKVANEINKIGLKNIEIPSDELTNYITTLQTLNGDNTLLMQKRLTFLAIQRIYNDLNDNFAAVRNELARIKALSADIFECFQQFNIFILPLGEIENYYQTYSENQYKISDNKKTDYFLSEYDYISSLNSDDISTKYPKLVTFLNLIFPLKTIDCKKFMSRNIGDLIHKVQSMFQMNNSSTQENIKTNPQVNWETYQRIISIIEFLPTDTGFTCRIELTSEMLENYKKQYTFDQNTVASLFTI